MNSMEVDWAKHDTITLSTRRMNEMVHHFWGLE